MSAQARGVLIGNASAFVRLIREDQRRADDGMTTVRIEVKAGTFTGTVRDDTLVGVATFREELERLYQNLTGTATLGSYEQFTLSATGDGRGSIRLNVEIHEHLLMKLTFETEIDQTFLPAIIRALEAEFPDG